MADHGNSPLGSRRGSWSAARQGPRRHVHLASECGDPVCGFLSAAHVAGRGSTDVVLYSNLRHSVQPLAGALVRVSASTTSPPTSS